MKQNVSGLLKAALLVLTSVFLGGCGSAQSPFNDAMSVMGADLKKIQRSFGSADTMPMATSGLQGIFNDSNQDKEWPRVALTIESMDSNSFEVSSGAPNSHADSCLTLSAVVWESQSISHKVPAFEACGSELKNIKGVTPRSYKLGNMLLGHWSDALNAGCYDSHKLCSKNSVREGPMYPMRIPLKLDTQSTANWTVGA